VGRWLAVVCTLAVACGGSGRAAPPAPTAADAPTEEQGSIVAEAVRSRVDVFGSATAAAPAQVLDRSGELSGRLVFLVTDDPGGDRLEALLPVRPNGSRGWIPRDQVSLSRTTFRVEVALADHRLVVRDGDRMVLRSPIGVGTTETPTPGGAYYLKELLRPPDPTGPYGPYAYGLSGFSDTLADFARGEGVIGIHGTDDPAAVGTDVSHGCIRLPNDAITRLVEEIGLPLGTPVSITA
jgi:lipoprotein-anchoring transpeptidase ErfK/SrfK